MSKYGFGEGTRVVEITHLGGHSHVAFGIVVRATRAIAHVEMYEPDLKNEQWDAGSASSDATCSFDQRVEPSDMRTYRWLPSLERMGQGMRGSLCGCTLEKFDPDTLYQNRSYY